jgi:rhodanese-related sulfurtransferase
MLKPWAQVLAEPPEGVQLIDVREPQELALAAISAFDNLPLSQFQTWSDTIHSRLMRNKKPSSCATTACDRPRCANG